MKTTELRINDTVIFQQISYGFDTYARKYYFNKLCFSSYRKI